MNALRTFHRDFSWHCGDVLPCCANYHDAGADVVNPIEEAKRLIADPSIPMTLTAKDRIVRIEVLEALIARAELAGAVTPGPSSRQIIRERIARLANGEAS